MTKEDCEAADKILRYLYLSENKYAKWIDIYTDSGILKAKADFIYDILKSYGYISPFNKGDGTLDSRKVKIEESGIVFFSQSSFLEKHGYKSIEKYTQSIKKEFRKQAVEFIVKYFFKIIIFFLTVILLTIIIYFNQ